MPLDIHPVTSTDPKLYLHTEFGEMVRRPTAGEPLTGWPSHFSTCPARQEKAHVAPEQA